MLLHIRGIPGSGKTWMCRELNKLGVDCLDTDDVLTACFNEYHDLSKKTWWIDLERRAKRHVNIRLQDAKRNRTSLVIVGISLGVFSRCPNRVFLKLNGAQLEESYRRLLLRELEKLILHQEDVKRIIRTAPAQEVSVLNYFAVDHVVANVDMSFREYQKTYKDALTSEKKRGTKIMYGRELFQEILGNVRPGDLVC